MYRLTLDDVIQGLVLTTLDGRFSLGVDAIDRGQIGFALIDRHRLRGTVLINWLLKVAPGSSLVPSGS